MKAQSLDQIISLLQPNDSLAVPLATGQPINFLNALSNRSDWKGLEIFSGLFVFPYPILMNPAVHITSGYYGPIERMLNEAGANIEYLPANFTGFEIYALKKNHRVIAATLSAPDSDGFCTFGTHAAACDIPFRRALNNPNQIAIAEINKSMPVVYGDPHHGDNKIHISELQYFFETESAQIELPPTQASEIEIKIAENVISLLKNADTLQFGIGGIPNAIASLLSHSSLGDFGIHSELISDGFLNLLESGKISNTKKGQFEKQSVFTFAFGSQRLYDFLDERNNKNKRQAICLPVSTVNNPAIIAKNNQMVSINAGLMIDFAGQVASESIGLRQYSGVGGQLQFVDGAYHSPGGRSIICIKSTAKINDQLVSNIMPTLPLGAIVSTPRHYTQYIVTEYGIANLYGVGDEHRAKELIAIAHPQFRDQLKEDFEKMKTQYFKN